jgi:hypothetical protein
LKQEEMMDSLVNTNSKIVTDLVNNEMLMSRAKIVSTVNDAIFEKYTLTLVDSFRYDLGAVRIYSVEPLTR